MKTKITVSVFLIMLVLFGLVLALPGDEQSVLNENRTPQSMPEVSFNNIFLGDFCEDYETYLSDNVGFRGILINLSNKISSLKGLKTMGYISNANGDLGTGDTSADKGLLVAEEKIMEIFKKKDTAKEAYIELINHYAELLPEDINLYNMIVPTQIEFEEKKYSSLADSQKAVIEDIYSGADKRVVCVDAYTALKENKDKYIYFRTDHHWTTLGAYYAYREFAKDAKVEAADISEFEENKAENFLGYLYNQAQATELKEKPDTIYYYTKGEILPFDAFAWEDGGIVNYKGKVFNIPYSGEETKYSVFMGGDHPMLYLNTNVENDRTLLILKDSYANAFMPWLSYSFENIIAVDPRSFGGDLAEVIKDYDVTDVLLMNYTFTTTFEDIISLEKGIYK